MDIKAYSNWAPEQVCTPVVEKIDDELIGRIDPGHDGIDPGAVRDGANEKDLMLTLRRGVAEALVRSGKGCDGLHAVG
jgi:N-acetylmuramoyl-L-alanine amidase